MGACPHGLAPLVWVLAPVSRPVIDVFSSFLYCSPWKEVTAQPALREGAVLHLPEGQGVFGIRLHWRFARCPPCIPLCSHLFYQNELVEIYTTLLVTVQPYHLNKYSSFARRALLVDSSVPLMYPKIVEFLPAPPFLLLLQNTPDSCILCCIPRSAISPRSTGSFTGEWNHRTRPGHWLATLILWTPLTPQACGQGPWPRLLGLHIDSVAC